MKYDAQYIGTHLKFIWSAPNYFIIQPLDGRLTSCKMAANGEEKALEEEKELDYRTDTCRVTKGAHTEHL
jgi:hypothetical protein